MRRSTRSGTTTRRHRRCRPCRAQPIDVRAAKLRFLRMCLTPHDSSSLAAVLVQDSPGPKTHSLHDGLGQFDDRLVRRLSAFYGLNIIPSVIWSTLAGNLVASIPAYQLNRRWTWGQARQEPVPARGRAVLGAHLPRHRRVPTRRSLGAPRSARPSLESSRNTDSSSLPTWRASPSFWVLKLIVFNRIFRVDTVEEIDEHLNIESTD